MTGMAAVTARRGPRRGPGPAWSGPGADRCGQPTRTGPRRLPGRAGPCGPGRCWSWLPRPRPRCGPAGSGSRSGPGSGWCRPLPGIWPSLHLDTAITLPVGVEAYAAYALRAWLGGEPAVSDADAPVREVVGDLSFALGMAGQVAYHLLAQAGMTRAPWAVTTIVSCLPVLVLAMGTALAHMLRADAEATVAPDSRTGPAAVLRSLSRSAEDQDGPGRRTAAG